MDDGFVCSSRIQRGFHLSGSDRLQGQMHVLANSGCLWCLFSLHVLFLYTIPQVKHVNITSIASP